MSYVIKGKYQNGAWEEIDTAKDEQEANYLTKEYIIAFGTGWQIKAVRKGGKPEKGECVNEGFI